MQTSLKTLIQTNILFARAVSFFNASLKTHKKSSPAFLFCAIWIFINLTKKLVGGILKEREMSDYVGRLHIVV